MANTKIDNAIRLSIVLPCYNEAENLPLLLEAYARAWDDLPAELLLVDNGSTDGTAQTLERELSRPDRAFARAIRIETNRGYGQGIFTGLQAARGEYLAFSHADMQCSPADVFTAYRRLLEEPDPRRALVKGKRAGRGWSEALVTNTMAALATGVLWRRLTDINAQPKVFHRSHLERLTAPPDGFQFDLYVLYRFAQPGLKIVTVPVVFGQRAHGQSKWAFSFVSRYRTIWATVVYIFQLRLAG